MGPQCGAMVGEVSARSGPMWQCTAASQLSQWHIAWAWIMPAVQCAQGEPYDHRTSARVAVGRSAPLHQSCTRTRMHAVCLQAEKVHDCMDSLKEKFAPKRHGME